MSDDELAKELRDMGCPFEMLDHRTRIWMDGYQAGHKQAQQFALASLDRIAGETLGKSVQ